MPPQSSDVGFVQHGSGGMRCPRCTNGTTSQVRSCFSSRERLTLQRRKHAFGRQGAPSPDSTLVALRQGPFIPLPEGRGLLAPKGKELRRAFCRSEWVIWPAPAARAFQQPQWISDNRPATQRAFGRGGHSHTGLFRDHVAPPQSGIAVYRRACRWRPLGYSWRKLSAISWAGQRAPTGFTWRFANPGYRLRKLACCVLESPTVRCFDRCCLVL
jgi:hypothetical protein